MSSLKYLFIALIFVIPANSFGGEPITQNEVNFRGKARADEELYAYYDLRNRNTFIQVTHEDNDFNPLCIHIQIFQQDQGCSELNFNDQLTPNDTVVYDMDNLIRNNGTAVPINLNDDSYGIVTVSAARCDSNTDTDLRNPLIGNFRIIDDSGYEYRMNMISDRGNGMSGNNILEGTFDTPQPALSNVIIPFNTVDGANQADIIAFITEDNRNLAGVADADGNDPDDQDDDLVYNEEAGITFSIFQLDENEERLSCDQKTFGCGPGVTLNYGINEDYPNSKGGPLLCEGAGLVPGQTNGYISLENASFLSSINDILEEGINSDGEDETFEFICLYGLNNGNGTGSMDSCLFVCVDDDGEPFNCREENG